ncbi:LysM peptidoglycan-binding domain-containing protein [Liquorilactobacillus oeni]|uniref:LysM domain-containing protein n=1 Tax=Liquorilactobacillus oeni DSM 19972 TaxID=1423777 RepID=A0A0R1MAG1_9LACO|nr:LysM domain-containing protein [Liquorilactobacillus oeni]KRL05119.1 hypothetical protein FD46_GL001064 [Liquorilactobacillus oeni DSM 19972]
MNNESINKVQVVDKRLKLKAAAAAALISGALFTVPIKADADTTNWTANSPQQIASQITNMQQLYTIHNGDTLWGISEALKAKGSNISVAQLAAINNIPNENLIYTGNSLKFAGKTIVVPQQPASNEQSAAQQSSSSQANSASSSDQVDKSALEAKLQEANKYLYTNGVYTEQSLENLRNTAYRGNGIIKSDTVSQTDVTNAINEITNAINGLQEAALVVNKQPLETKLQEANKYLYTNGTYTDTSLQKLSDAAVQGNGVIKAANPTQQNVTDAVAKIDQAINNLQKIQQQAVNKTQLQAKIGQAESYLKQTDVYTSDSLNNLQISVQKGHSTMTSDEVTQAAINTATDNIQNAINELVKK